MFAADCRARFAIEHAVHEARGLDILPQTIQRLREGDNQSADLLQEVHQNEHEPTAYVWLKSLVLWTRCHR